MNPIGWSSRVQVAPPTPDVVEISILVHEQLPDEIFTNENAIKIWAVVVVITTHDQNGNTGP